jgi:hypothetical protein
MQAPMQAPMQNTQAMAQMGGAYGSLWW